MLGLGLLPFGACLEELPGLPLHRVCLSSSLQLSAAGRPLPLHPPCPRYRLSRPAPKYAPWFNVPLKTARLAVKVQQGSLGGLRLLPWALAPRARSMLLLHPWDSQRLARSQLCLPSLSSTRARGRPDSLPCPLPHLAPPQPALHLPPVFPARC